MSELVPAGYDDFLSEIKERVRAAQVRAMVAVNTELIAFYWWLGRRVVEEQARQQWGDSVLQRLARDLKAAFPDMGGFSRTNLYRVRAFYLAYKDMGENIPQVVGQIAWGQNVTLIEKVKDNPIRLWYAEKAVENGWSRAVLEHQIETRLHERQGAAITNFAQTLPPPQSDLAQQLLKDPYNFDFLTLGEDAHERHLEAGLLTHIREFLLELGQGFAFVGSQYPLTVGQSEFFIDLLFYHLRLRCLWSLT